MKLKQVAGKSLIYDGTEDDFYKSYFVTLDNGDVISIPPIINTRLKDLHSNKTLTTSVISSLKNIKFIDFGNDLYNYQNEFGLTVFVCEDEKYIAIVSKGEVNRGVFKIILEGVFQAPQANNTPT